MKFVVKITYRGLVDYIGNGSYRVNKEKYAVFTGDENQAKRYRSYAVAKRAYETLKETCANLDGDVEYVKVDETHFDRHRL